MRVHGNWKRDVIALGPQVRVLVEPLKVYVVINF